MEALTQQLFAFHLTRKRAETALKPIEHGMVPVGLAPYLDLSTLRYDFPLILRNGVPPKLAIASLSRLVDDACEAMSKDKDHLRIARHGFALEERVRKALGTGETRDFFHAWQDAACDLRDEYGESVQDSSDRLWRAFGLHGAITDIGEHLPVELVKHVWTARQSAKAKAFKDLARALVHRLHETLAAEEAESDEGRSPERLKAGVGSGFAGAFDFGTMSTLLVQSKPGNRIGDARRNRIRWLIHVLETQRFFPLNEESSGYEFAFVRCSDALAAFQERHAEAVEVAKAFAIAKLEAKGDYRESIHDVLFQEFGATGLDASDLALLPDSIVCLRSGDVTPEEATLMVDLLASGLPFKVLLHTEDLLEPSPVTEGHFGLGTRSRQAVHTALGLTDVFVLQASASRLYRVRDALARGMEFGGPSLFSVFAANTESTFEVPGYLVAAAAAESRTFPTLVYDPSLGPDWADRMEIGDNPSPEQDWPDTEVLAEAPDLTSVSLKSKFTLAHFLALDRRAWHHFAVVPPQNVDSLMIPVDQALPAEDGAGLRTVPTLQLVDRDFGLVCAVVDERMLHETRRCLGMWRSLQELGGIGNSFAARAKEIASTTVEQSVEVVPVAEVEEPVSASEPSPAGDEPMIETARCTSCNECIQINPKLFVYNQNKQAMIGDLAAGTFRQLVEAAEGCQVGIIHPGKPKNPKEPGLEDLIRRAAAFN